MKTIHFLLIALFLSISFYTQAQEKELYIEYDFNSKAHEFCKTIEVKACVGKCLSKTIRRLMISSRENPEGAMEEQYYYTFKDYGQNVMKCDSDWQLHYLYIQENMDNMHWQPINECDTILGYKCMKAKTHFRGRDYEAYFTTDLPFKAAPWKFHNLPGVVLKVYSLDDFVKMEATSLKINKQKKKLKYPHRNKKHVSWEEHMVLNQKLIDKFQETARAVNAEDLGDDCLLIMPSIEKMHLEVDKSVTKFLEVK
jgi:GLPGLI family protein